MFKINYRIVDDFDLIINNDKKTFDEDPEIEGFFQLKFDNNIEGYYHDKELSNGEEGLELLINWFDLLLEVSENLKINNYVAFQIPEIHNRWIELSLLNENINASLIKDKEEKEIRPIIINTPPKMLEYLNWKNIKILKKDFFEEVAENVKLFVQDLVKLNNKLENSKVLISFLNRAHDLTDNV